MSPSRSHALLLPLAATALAAIAIVLSASNANAEATYTAVATTSLGSPLNAIDVGETVTIDITLRSDGEETLGVSASATGYDPEVIGFETGVAARNLLAQICLPGAGCFGGLTNIAVSPVESLLNPLGPAVQFANAASASPTFNTGSIDEGWDGTTGGAQFRLVFEALAAGETSITLGSLDAYGDATTVAEGVGITNNAVLNLTVIPERLCGDVNFDGLVDSADPSALLQDLAGLGVGLAAPDNCSVIGFKLDCDIVDAAVLLRSTDTPPLPPGISDACKNLGPLSPDNFPGLALWLDAADATTISFDAAQQVSSWSDKSPSLNLMTATGAMSPTLEALGLNGLPALRFDGVENVLVGDSAMNLTAGTTMFFVASHDRRKNYQGLFSIRSDPTTDAALEVYWQAGSAGSGNLVYVSDRNDATDGGFFGSNNAGPPPPAAYLATVLVDSDTAPGEIRIGSSTLPNNQVSGSGLFTNDIDLPYVGYGFGDTPDTGAQNRLLEGTLAEVIVFSRPLERDEIESVEAYLLDKWGL